MANIYLGVDPTDSTPFFFISYNSEDAEQIKPLVSEMGNILGIPLWYDYGIPFGEKWRIELNKRIDSSEAVFLFVSKKLLLRDDSYAWIEVDIARGRKKKVIPLLLDRISDEEVPINTYDRWAGNIQNNNYVELYKMKDQEEAIQLIRRVVSDISRQSLKLRDISILDKQDPVREKQETVSEEKREENMPEKQDSTSELSSENIELIRSAEKGDAAACNNLGVNYMNGQGVKKDYEKAFYWFRKAADKGLARGQYNLGRCYWYGWGGMPDQEIAVIFLRRAAEQGHGRAQFFIGWCYDHAQGGVKQDLPEAVKWYRKAAEQDVREAQVNLGMCCQEGRGMAQDLEEGAKWFRRAAEAKFVPARNSLGICYELGKGVEKDEMEAVKWYRKAAEDGMPEAQGNLARCLEYGIGTARDPEEAEKWRRRSAEKR